MKWLYMACVLDRTERTLEPGVGRRSPVVCMALSLLSIMSCFLNFDFKRIKQGLQSGSKEFGELPLNFLGVCFAFERNPGCQLKIKIERREIGLCGDSLAVPVPLQVLAYAYGSIENNWSHG